MTALFVTIVSQIKPYGKTDCSTNLTENYLRWIFFVDIMNA
jgi:hypothetical protein